jgi:hypothetical protein
VPFNSPDRADDDNPSRLSRSLAVFKTLAVTRINAAERLVASSIGGRADMGIRAGLLSRRFGDSARPCYNRPERAIVIVLPRGKTEEAIMATDPQQATPGATDIDPDPTSPPAQIEHDSSFISPISKERQAEIERIVSQRNLPLIEAGVEAYKRDLPRLLSENRYQQWVAYRGSELVAFGSSYRRLRKKLEKMGFTHMGEFFMINVAPLELDDDAEHFET